MSGGWRCTVFAGPGDINRAGDTASRRSTTIAVVVIGRGDDVERQRHQGRTANPLTEDTRGQRATGEKPQREHPAASLRGNGSADNIVVGHSDDPADESIERPQHQEAARDPRARRSGDKQQNSDQSQAAGAAERAHDIETAFCGGRAERETA